MHVGVLTSVSCRREHEPSPSADSSELSWWEEERASLQQTLRALQTQFAGERARREEVERQAELLAEENGALEQQLSGMEACRVGHMTDPERTAGTLTL